LSREQGDEREKFSCRSCETIATLSFDCASFAGPSLLAMMLVVGKYANHQPLNRQSEQYAREGVELSVSTMADHVSPCAGTLTPLERSINGLSPDGGTAQRHIATGA